MNFVKFLYTTLLLILYSISLYSQKSIYPVGIYYSLKEIQNKEPKDTSLVKIEQRTEAAKRSWGGNDFEPVSNQIRRAAFRSEVYAVSNGDTLFLNCIFLNGEPWFTNVLSEGEFLVFKALVTGKESSLTDAFAAGFLFGLNGVARYEGSRTSYGAKLLFIMNSTTGIVKLLDKRYLLDILNNYPEIKTQYEKEPDNWSKEVLIKYASLINRASKK